MQNTLEAVTSEAEFLAVYPTAQENWERASISWDELEAIRAHYRVRMPALQTTADAFSARLQTLPGVHSTRVRLKHPDHLLDKIVRKRTAERVINIDNYLAEITDLIGARALHLFKTDWLAIHEAVLETWDQNEPPKAYVREGDDAKFYEENDVNAQTHAAGYRSVHYGVKTAFTKETHVVELQVRTIFEEAWGEIDHSVRYPYFEGDTFLEASCGLLNRLAGSADEMALLIRLQQAATLKWGEREAQLKAQNQEKELALQKMKSELEATIRKSEANEEQQKEMLRQVESLSESEYSPEISPEHAAVYNVMVGSLSPLALRAMQNTINPSPAMMAAMQSTIHPSSAVIAAIHRAGYAGVAQSALAAQAASGANVNSSILGALPKRSSKRKAKIEEETSEE